MLGGNGGRKVKWKLKEQKALSDQKTLYALVSCQ